MERCESTPFKGSKPVRHLASVHCLSVSGLQNRASQLNKIPNWCLINTTFHETCPVFEINQDRTPKSQNKNKKDFKTINEKNAPRHHRSHCLSAMFPRTPGLELLCLTQPPIRSACRAIPQRGCCDIWHETEINCRKAFHCVTRSAQRVFGMQRTSNRNARETRAAG